MYILLNGLIQIDVIIICPKAHSFQINYKTNTLKATKQKNDLLLEDTG